MDASFRERLAAQDIGNARVEPVGTFGYRQRPNSRYPYVNGTAATSNARAYRGPLVDSLKPPGTFRIVLLGGSTTHGWGVDDDETIDAYARPLLAARYPTQRFEVVNLAFDGFDALRLLERLRAEGLPLDPDLVIVNSGINDVRLARFSALTYPDPRVEIWEGVLEQLRAERRRGRPSFWTIVKRHVWVARLPALTRSRRPGKRAPAPSEGNPAAVEYYANSIRGIIRLTDSAGVPLILATPASALDWYDSSATSLIDYWVVNAGTTRVLREQLAARLLSLADSATHVTYLPRPVLPREAFLDDCHLTPGGNRAVAAHFVEAAGQWIRPSPTGAISQRGELPGPAIR